MIENKTLMITPLELLNLYLSDGKSKGNTDNELYQKFNREFTWDALLNHGYQGNSAPILYSIIRNNSDLELSDKNKDDLKELYHQYRGKHVMQFSELDKILQAFECEKIDVIPLKGAYIANNYYADPVLRPMSDIDLLVRQEEMERAKACLETLGYHHTTKVDEKRIQERHYHFVYIKNTRIMPVIVELHFDIKSTYDFIRSDILELWNNASPVDQRNNHILKIPKEYLLLYVIWHTYLSLSRRLIMNTVWLVDIVRMIQLHKHELDWKFILEKAREWGIENQLCLMLYLTSEIFPADDDSYNILGTIQREFSLKMFRYIMLNKNFTAVIEKDKDIIFVILLNLISMNTITDKLKYFLTYNAKNPLTKFERIQGKHVFASKPVICLYYIGSQVLLFMSCIKGIIRFLFSESKRILTLDHRRTILKP